MMRGHTPLDVCNNPNNVYAFLDTIVDTILGTILDTTLGTFLGAVCARAEHIMGTLCTWYEHALDMLSTL